MKKVQVLFFLVMFVIGTDTFLISPLLPQLREIFHVSKAVSGWMVGVYALGYACLSIFAGPLSDGWNRKKVMFYGMLAFALSTFLCGISPGFWSMLLFRLLAGLSAAVAAPQVWASIASLFPPQRIIRVMGIATGGLAVSQAVGVPFGSFMAEKGWFIPFFIIGGVSFILALAILVWIPSLPAKVYTSQTSIMQRYRELIQIKQAQNVFLAYFMFQTGNFAAFTFLGTWLADRFGLNNTGIGVVMFFLGLGNVLGSFYGGAIVHKVGTARTLVSGMLVLAALYVLLPYCCSTTDVKAGYFFIFAIAGTIFPVMMTMLTSLSSNLRGTISSLASATMYAATALGSLIGGLLYVHVHGFQAICFFTAICFLVSVTLFVNSRVPLPVRGS